MATPVSSMTPDECHAEFTKLTDKIAAKYEELNSGEFGDVDSPAFKAKSHELAMLCARMSQLCARLKLPWPTNLWRPPYFKH